MGYSYFYIQAQYRLREDADDLAKRLHVAAAEKDYLGLAGPNPEWTRSVLRTAMSANKGRNLRGRTIVYLGPSNDAGKVKAMIEPSGATLRYVV